MLQAPERPTRPAWRPPWRREPRAGPQRSPTPRSHDGFPAELPAELLRRLEFTVVRRLDGFLFGSHRGVFHGPSLDLAEVREYQPGDEVRRIDWPVTARTGTLHIRQYREERELVAVVAVDRSASMDLGTRGRLKRELALEFAAVAAAVVARSGKVGALSFSPAGVRSLPLGGGRRQALAVLHHLSEPLPAAAAGPGDLAAALDRLQRTMRRRVLVFVVSDFLGEPLEPGSPPAWQRPLAMLAARHEVVAVRVVDPIERSLPAGGDLRVRDPETGAEAWIDTGDRRVRDAFAALVAQREAALERAFAASGAARLELATDRDLIGPLAAFALRRRGRRP